MRLPKLFFYRFCIAFFSYSTGKLVETWQQCSMSTFLTPNTYMMADSFEHRAFKSTHWSDPPPPPPSHPLRIGGAGGGWTNKTDKQTDNTGGSAGRVFPISENSALSSAIPSLSYYTLIFPTLAENRLELLVY